MVISRYALALSLVSNKHNLFTYNVNKARKHLVKMSAPAPATASASDAKNAH
jgi:hypothetical protein